MKWVVGGLLLAVLLWIFSTPPELFGRVEQTQVRGASLPEFQRLREEKDLQHTNCEHSETVVQDGVVLWMGLKSPEQVQPGLRQSVQGKGGELRVLKDWLVRKPGAFAPDDAEAIALRFLDFGWRSIEDVHGEYDDMDEDKDKRFKTMLVTNANIDKGAHRAKILRKVKYSGAAEDAQPPPLPIAGNKLRERGPFGRLFQWLDRRFTRSPQ